MKYYAYTIGLCASLGGLLLVCTGLYSEEMSKGDAMGLCFVFIIMAIKSRADQKQTQQGRT